MATECERTFISAKKLITPERNALSDATIEASEYLKAWWDQGLITRGLESYGEKSWYCVVLSIIKSYFFSSQRLSFLIWKALIPGLAGRPTRPGREVPAWIVRPVGSTGRRPRGPAPCPWKSRSQALTFRGASPPW
jgi:hypothetical protein